MSRFFELEHKAAADLRSITLYTRQKWGDPQARVYIAALKEAIMRLARGQRYFKDVSTLYPGLRMVRCQQHFIFYLPRTNKLPLVIAILHRGMDIIAQLSERLSGGS